MSLGNPNGGVTSAPALAAPEGAGDAVVASDGLQTGTVQTTAQPAQGQQPQPAAQQIYTEADFNALRSSLQSQVAQTELVARQALQEVQTQQTNAQLDAATHQQVTGLADQYYAYYKGLGYDDETAQRGAAHYAEEQRAQIRQNLQQQAEVYRKAQQFDTQQQVRGRQQAVGKMWKSVREATGLTNEELTVAVKDLSPAAFQRQSDFELAVWQRATAALRTRNPQQAQAAEAAANRQFANTIRMPGSGTEAGGPSFTGGPPPGMDRRDPKYFDYLMQFKGGTRKR